MSTLFTSKTRQALLAGLRSGLTLAEVCADAGLAEQTAKGWLKRGRREAGTDYSAFSAAVDDARETAAFAEMELEEFHEHLAAAIRKGSVTAMRLYWQIHRAEEPSGPLSELDELDALSARIAERKRRRSSGDSIFDELHARKDENGGGSFIEELAARKLAGSDTYINPDAEEAK